MIRLDPNWMSNSSCRASGVDASSYGLQNPPSKMVSAFTPQKHGLHSLINTWHTNIPPWLWIHLPPPSLDHLVGRSPQSNREPGSTLRGSREKRGGTDARSCLKLQPWLQRCGLTEDGGLWLFWGQWLDPDPVTPHWNPSMTHWSSEEVRSADCWVGKKVQKTWQTTAMLHYKNPPHFAELIQRFSLQK